MNLWLAIPTFVATICWLAFIVTYWVRAKWWRGPLGRNTMFVSMALFFILLRLSLLNIFPHLKPSTLGGFILYNWIAWLAVQRMYIANKAQNADDPKGD